MAMLNKQMVIEDKGMEQTITNTVHKLWTITILMGNQPSKTIFNS